MQNVLDAASTSDQMDVSLRKKPLFTPRKGTRAALPDNSDEETFDTVNIIPWEWCSSSPTLEQRRVLWGWNWQPSASNSPKSLHFDGVWSHAEPSWLQTPSKCRRWSIFVTLGGHIETYKHRRGLRY
ncbi:hypothetical protein DFH08DRAFT_807402 [Mycena albidolilacea]|uniref:Uncharacterized protein n=1 Tax=Mycena albidolilacea TaxID=1033008 RepID=A0AAD7EV53_9AGAR|nr:hypothetical protein DFH08DRAFT_807402 [Mycena albidolilacea]